jgi:hypothetical protein
VPENDRETERQQAHADDAEQPILDRQPLSFAPARRDRVLEREHRPGCHDKREGDLKHDITPNEDQAVRSDRPDRDECDRAHEAQHARHDRPEHDVATAIRPQLRQERWNAVLRLSWPRPASANTVEMSAVSFPTSAAQ